MFVWWDRNILDRFYKVGGFPDTIWYQFLNLVLILLFLFEFFNRKTLFFVRLNFLYLLYNFVGYLFQCGVSSFYHVTHRINVRVCLDTEIDRLAVYDLGGVQAVLGVQSLERLKSSLIYDFRFYFGRF